LERFLGNRERGRERKVKGVVAFFPPRRFMSRPLVKEKRKRRRGCPEEKKGKKRTVLAPFLPVAFNSTTVSMVFRMERRKGKRKKKKSF